ncbi:MAG TPA: DinB family protein [Gemmatimonadaceae bacterium]|nr:DinB family protein [Gemmatimonadaceae bacterium]
MTSTSFRSTRPADGEFLPYYGKYIDRVPQGDVIETLATQLTETLALIRSISESDGDKRYAPGKWSIRDVIGHVIDGERIFVYRALRFSRADSTPVPGFEENDYAANGPYSQVSLSDLADEFEHVRRATIQFFSHLDDVALSRRGAANNAEISVRALAFIIAGHETHHMAVLRDRYLNS